MSTSDVKTENGLKGSAIGMVTNLTGIYNSPHSRIMLDRPLRQQMLYYTE